MITSLNNSAGVTLETDILVITVDDNTAHTYCSKISWEKDNINPIGTAKIVIPYSTSIEEYWSKYSGMVVIHANLNDYKKTTTSKTPTTIQSKRTKDNKIRLQNNEYNYSFIGKVHTFKQVGKNFIVYLEDLGWKFLQKVPDNFRKQYIAGQTLDKAFQAICEIMGIEFAYSIEELSQYNFSADGYSIEKDGTIIEDTPSILEDFNQNDTEDQITNDETMGKSLQNDVPEGSGLIELLQNKKKENNTNNTKQDEKALNQLIVNQQSQTPVMNEETEKEIEKQQKEFDEKIKDLFKGNTLYDSNISDPILNYSWITVQPTSPTTSDISSSITPTPNDANSNTSDNQNTSSNSTSKSTNTGSSVGVKGVWGKTAGGSFYLTQDAINKMSMATMEKLWYRMMFGTKFY